ncbi:putative nucleic acid-binding protein [Haloferula luteola]|uniref:Ribonuclease VapC n=1 Tax=Haloferula luteola TaxID=595692 RepID=A0A840V5Y7_9BACT|nr:type II toxin-antitoxin system VapC family toxin [Haloferula luteola]MBB5353667.1 putative nucleic acid-binding protein [Haloferula luteola]
MPSHLLDRSAWIECLDNGPNTRHFAPILRKLPDLIVPAIVITEVRKVVLKQRTEEKAQAVTDAMLSGIVISLDPGIATHAADLFIKHKLPLADSIIYATALAHKATVWTQDDDFKGLPHVKYFPKATK